VESKSSAQPVVVKIKEQRPKPCDQIWLAKKTKTNKDETKNR
jgi:hypothetical protein